jgi:hypothetical protein
MFIRLTFIASLLAVFGYASAAYANSCSNVVTLGSYDQSGLIESEYGISAVGTFRVAEEEDEAKQPNFNLAFIDCQKQSDDMGRVSLECKVTEAVVQADKGKPDTDNPNCTLDVIASEYSMKELQKGILVGMEQFASAICFNTTLTIDRNTKRVYLSFTRTKDADKADKTFPGICRLPRTQVLMNCTGWPRIRKQGQTLPPRYCDFSSSSDKVGAH